MLNSFNLVKTDFYIFLMIIICIWVPPTFAQSNFIQSEKAKIIFSEMINRDDGNTLYSEILLATCAYRNVNGISKCSSDPIKKRIESISIDVGDSLENTISLGIINDPPSEKNMAFLQKDYDEEGKETDQWMYFPALKKQKRIISESANSPKTGSVFGSEISYEDIEKKHISNYTYSYEGIEEITNRPCDKITIYPNENHKPKTSYIKEIFWVDQETKLSLKREVYDKKDKLVKTFFVRNIVELNGIWINKMRIALNHKTKYMTMEKVLKLAVNIPIERELVSSRALKDASYRESKMKIIREFAK